MKFLTLMIAGYIDHTTDGLKETPEILSPIVVSGVPAQAVSLP